MSISWLAWVIFSISIIFDILLLYDKLIQKNYNVYDEIVDLGFSCLCGRIQEKIKAPYTLCVALALLPIFLPLYLCICYLFFMAQSIVIYINITDVLSVITTLIMSLLKAFFRDPLLFIVLGLWMLTSIVWLKTLYHLGLNTWVLLDRRILETCNLILYVKMKLWRKRVYTIIE